jgi:hypothetical protein
MTETLRQKQTRFALAVARLIQKADEMGYEMTLGEVERSKAQAVANAASGAGISNSLHLERLAIDLHLFKAGRYIMDGEGHAELGRWWKTLSPDHRHGGDFKSKDHNHYSLSPDGKRA